MAKRELTTSPEPIDRGLVVALVLAVVAIAAAPATLFIAGIYWAALVALAVFLLWTSTMPSSCMNGGFIFSLVMLALLGNVLGTSLMALAKLVISLVA